jgi:hypothetical protein
MERRLPPVSVSLRPVISIDRRDKAVITLIAIFVVETVCVASESEAPSAQSETAMVAAANDPTSKGLTVRIGKFLAASMVVPYRPSQLHRWRCAVLASGINIVGAWVRILREL